MLDILYYGAVTKVENEERLVIEYRFVVGQLPIAVVMQVFSGGDSKTYEQLFYEAMGYLQSHMAMVKEMGRN